MKINNQLKLAAAIAASIALMGCGSDDETSTDHTDSGFALPENAIYVSPNAEDGTDITEEFITAVTDISPDTVVVLPKGNFLISSTINITDANGITITGHGINSTKLDFSTSSGNDGIFFDGGNGLTIRDLGVYEVPKNGIKADGVNGIHFTYTAAVWETPLAAETADTENGAYGLYPVSSENVLMEYNYSKGSADAGIYVGQSNNIVVRHNIAEHNIAGIEIENSTMADVYNNEAFDNSGGILSFDLPGLPQAFGGGVRIFNNDTYANNTTNVGKGVVGDVPAGTGILILATSDVEIYNNNITDNNTSGVAITSFLLMDDTLSGEDYTQTIADGWTPMVKNISIHDNTFKNNSSNPPSGGLLDDAIQGYQSQFNASGQAQDMPAIVYDGVGELMSDWLYPEAGGATGMQALGVTTAIAYTTAELNCVYDNVNANDAELDLNIGSMYGVDPDEEGNIVAADPEATLRFSAMGDESTILNCATAPTRLAAATVTFKGETYGCEADDIDLAACKL